MAAKKKSASLGDKVKKVLKDTAKQTGKDLLTLGTIVGPGKAVKAAKTAKSLKTLTATKKVRSGVAENRARGASGDYVVGGRGSKNMMPKAGKADAKYSFGRDTELSRNIKIKDTKSPSGKTRYTGGTLQVLNQNARLARPLTKAEAKANARGLKAANKPTNKVGSKADKALRSRTKSVVMSKEETKANYDYYYGKGSGEGITQINKRVTPKNEARSVRKMPKKK
jgi:hypothetical protein